MCEVIFGLSLLVIALYAWQTITGSGLAGIFDVSLLGASGFVISLILSLIFYFAISKDESFWPSYTTLVVTMIAIGLLVATTGGTSSPYIALFVLAGFASGLFSFYGALPVVLLGGTYVAVIYLQNQFSFDALIAIMIITLLPVAAGIVTWYGRNNKQEEESRREVKHMASQLSEVATTSEVVINAIGDGLIVFDAQGTIQLINPAAQELLGWSKHDSLMLNYKTVLRLTDTADKELDQAHDPIQQVLNSNQEVRRNDLTILTKSGKKMLASIVVSPIGEPGSGAITVFRDITKEKQEERAQAEFISTASHEMRTPVASIEGYLGLALNPQTSTIDEKAREFIKKAQESTQHLGVLFQDLLDVSKADDGRLANNPKVIDLIPFVGEIVEGLVPKAKAKGLELIYKPKPHSATRMIAPVFFVNLDVDHIREITDNLVENAIKYTKEGRVVVDISGTDDKVTLSIKDSGIGIPAEDIPHLFQKFYRVDNEDTRQIGGTGLGLYLCRRLAETMGGRLWVESQHKIGSTFFVELPRIDASTAHELKQRQEQEAAIAAQQAKLNPTPPVQPASPVVNTLQQATSVSGTVKGQSSGQVINDVTPLKAAPATTVPRGESLSREQISAQVARLEALAKQQRTTSTDRPESDQGRQAQA